MWKIIDDEEGYPKYKIGKKERERIAAVSVRYALDRSLLYGTLVAAFNLIASPFLSHDGDWPDWFNIIGWYIILFVGFFWWQRRALLKRMQTAIDSLNRTEKEQYFRDKNAKRRSTGMALERGEDEPGGR